MQGRVPRKWVYQNAQRHAVVYIVMLGICAAVYLRLLLSKWDLVRLAWYYLEPFLVSVRMQRLVRWERDEKGMHAVPRTLSVSEAAWRWKCGVRGKVCRRRVRIQSLVYQSLPTGDVPTQVKMSRRMPGFLIWIGWKMCDAPESVRRYIDMATDC